MWDIQRQDQAIPPEVWQWQSPLVWHVNVFGKASSWHSCSWGGTSSPDSSGRPRGILGDIPGSWKEKPEQVGQSQGSRGKASLHQDVSHVAAAPV